MCVNEYVHKYAGTIEATEGIKSPGAGVRVGCGN